MAKYTDKCGVCNKATSTDEVKLLFGRLICMRCWKKIERYVEDLATTAETLPSFQPQTIKAAAEVVQAGLEAGLLAGISDDIKKTVQVALDADMEKMTIKQLILAGLTDEQIVGLKGCKLDSVKQARSSAAKATPTDTTPTGKSPDGKKTYDCAKVMPVCKYSMTISSGSLRLCDFLSRTGRRRGCDPSRCTEFVRK